MKLSDVRNPGCRLCPLSETTVGNVCVMGRGDRRADIMLVGEAPGEAEAKTGKPFMGRAGQLLDRLLRELRVENQVYITNTCKCRPPGNRKPTPSEIKTCTRNYLWKEIQIVEPKVIVLLGKTALAGFTDFEGITRHKPLRLFIKEFKRDYYCVYTWHPAYCLRTGPRVAEELKNDIELAAGFAT